MQLLFENLMQQSAHIANLINNDSFSFNLDFPEEEGLDDIELRQIPTLKFKQKLWHLNEIDDTCPICFEDYKENDIVSKLPICDHAFHKKCVNSWLKKNRFCPLCRADVREKLFDKFGSFQSENQLSIESQENVLGKNLEIKSDAGDGYVGFIDSEVVLGMNSHGLDLNQTI